MHVPQCHIAGGANAPLICTQTGFCSSAGFERDSINAVQLVSLPGKRLVSDMTSLATAGGTGPAMAGPTFWQNYKILRGRAIFCLRQC